ncbi:hypothetical protein F4805DRAFT_435970 [Annulohypoxylon moriforme]|nr:hypothetical protein F4805DRAFT_435970 [Annulohypoxylon moriforme]
MPLNDSTNEMQQEWECKCGSSAALVFVTKLIEGTIYPDVTTGHIAFLCPNLECNFIKSRPYSQNEVLLNQHYLRSQVGGVSDTSFGNMKSNGDGSYLGNNLIVNIGFGDLERYSALISRLNSGPLGFLTREENSAEVYFPQNC